MTKMRVHELAKELGMENKELVDILQKKNVEIKNHMSTIEDNVADEIRREMSAKSGKTTGKPAEQAESKETAAPKKKNLAFVIRPQNSKNSSRIQGNRSAQRQARSGQPGTRPAHGARPAGDRPQRPARPTGEGRPAAEGRPSGERPVRPERSAQPARSAGEGRPAAENRPSGERPVRSERPAQPARNAGEGRPATENRPQGDRQARPDHASHGSISQEATDRGPTVRSEATDRRAAVHSETEEPGVRKEAAAISAEAREHVRNGESHEEMR